MKFHLALYAALVLAANCRFVQAQPATVAPVNAISRRQSVNIRVSVVAIAPVYARALGLAPNSDAPENAIGISRVSPETRVSLNDLSALKKATIFDEENNAAFDRQQTWSDVMISAPLQIIGAEIGEQWKTQIERINQNNTLPSAFRQALRLNMTPTLRDDGAFDLALSLSKNLTFGPAKQAIKLVINPDTTNQLMIAPENREYLKQKTVVLQSRDTEIINVKVCNDETIALINLSPEFSAQEFLPKASPSMKLIILLTPHIPVGNDAYVRAN